MQGLKDLNAYNVSNFESKKWANIKVFAITITYAATDHASQKNTFIVKLKAQFV